EAEQTLQRDGYLIAPFPVMHRVTAYGYAIVEHERPGRFDDAKARELGVTFGPDFGRLQRGETVNGVEPAQVMGLPRAGNKVVLDGPDIARTIVRIAHQIVEQTEGREIAIVGIHTRGAVLARRLAEQVSELVGQEIPLGELDISFYRDDVAMRDPARQPVV